MDKIALAELASSGRFKIKEPVGIIRCEPIWEFKPYLLRDYLFFGVLDGVGQAWIEGREMALGPGSCLLIPPGSALSALHDPKRRLRVFYLHLDFVDARGKVLSAAEVVQPSVPTVVRDLTTFEPLTRQVVEGHTAGSEIGRTQRDAGHLVPRHRDGRHTGCDGVSVVRQVSAPDYGVGRDWDDHQLCRGLHQLFP